MRRHELYLALGLALVGLACVTALPTGPRFEALPAPSLEESLVYIYRLDPLRGVEPIDLKLDGEDIGRLRNGEYRALTLAPGSHEVALELRLFDWLPRAWTRIPIEARSGETVYLKTWAGYQVKTWPGYREAEDEGPARRDAPGRAARRVAVRVFTAWRESESARSELQSCALATANK